MVNTHLKFEGKIHHSSKVVAFTRNYTKFSSFKANLTLKVTVKSFRTCPRPSCDQYMVQDKIQKPQKLTCAQGIAEMTTTMTEPKTIRGGRHNCTLKLANMVYNKCLIKNTNNSTILQKL